jgi:hypothetical protein
VHSSFSVKIKKQIPVMTKGFRPSVMPSHAIQVGVLPEIPNGHGNTAVTYTGYFRNPVQAWKCLPFPVHTFSDIAVHLEISVPEAAPGNLHADPEPSAGQLPYCILVFGVSQSVISVLPGDQLFGDKLIYGRIGGPGADAAGGCNFSITDYGCSKYIRFAQKNDKSSEGFCRQSEAEYSVWDTNKAHFPSTKKQRA